MLVGSRSLFVLHFVCCSSSSSGSVLVLVHWFRWGFVVHSRGCIIGYCSVVLSLSVVSLFVVSSCVCVVWFFIIRSWLLLSSQPCRIRSRWDWGVGVSEFVDVPSPKSFIHCDVQPVAEFPIWVLAAGGDFFSSGLAICGDHFGSFIR